MILRTAKTDRSVHKACPAGYTKIDGEDVFSWKFDENEMEAFKRDEKNGELFETISFGTEKGFHYFGPGSCLRIFYMAASAVSERDEKDPLWRLYDAILVGAYTGVRCGTGMVVEA